jgi:hypothetical protein
MMYSGALQQPGTTVDQIPDAIRIPGQSALAESFNSTFWVALVLIALCLVPAAFLPRKRPEVAPVEFDVDDAAAGEAPEHAVGAGDPVIADGGAAAVGDGDAVSEADGR